MTSKEYLYIYIVYLFVTYNFFINRAYEKLLQYKPKLELLGSNDDVPPLTDFFELVHVADVIQQMVQLYYEEEMVKFLF